MVGTEAIMATPQYIRNLWKHMIHRCYNPRYRNYKWYGARGVRVCERWRLSPAAIYEDVGDRPTPKHSLDRIDNDGDYCPENCRWATQKQQRRNTTKNHLVTYMGETKCITDWASDLGITVSALKYRLRHWGAEMAFSGKRHAVKKCRNGVVGKNKASRYIGVGKQSGGWQANLKKNRQYILRRYFTSELLAALAYDDAAFATYGHDAKLNFPERFRGRKGNTPAWVTGQSPCDRPSAGFLLR